MGLDPSPPPLQLDPLSESIAPLAFFFFIRCDPTGLDVVHPESWDASAKIGILTIGQHASSNKHTQTSKSPGLLPRRDLYLEGRAMKAADSIQELENPMQCTTI